MDNLTLKPWELVKDHAYYIKVLVNMGMSEDGAIVRFGTVGEGVHPNYQIAFANGEQVDYRGDNHKDKSKEPKYNPANLSRVYDNQGVQDLLFECIKRQVEKEK